MQLTKRDWSEIARSWLPRKKITNLRQYLEILRLVGQGPVPLTFETYWPVTAFPRLVWWRGSSRSSILTLSLHFILPQVCTITASCDSNPKYSQHSLTVRTTLYCMLSITSCWITNENVPHVQSCLVVLSFLAQGKKKTNLIQNLIGLPSTYQHPRETCLHQVDHLGLMWPLQMAHAQWPNLWLPEKCTF